MMSDQIEPVRLREVNTLTKRSLMQKPCLFTLIVYFTEIRAARIYRKSSK